MTEDLDFATIDARIIQAERKFRGTSIIPAQICRDCSDQVLRITREIVALHLLRVQIGNPLEEIIGFEVGHPRTGPANVVTIELSNDGLNFSYNYSGWSAGKEGWTGTSVSEFYVFCKRFGFPSPGQIGPGAESWMDHLYPYLRHLKEKKEIIVELDLKLAQRIGSLVYPDAALSGIQYLVLAAEEEKIKAIEEVVAGHQCKAPLPVNGINIGYYVGPNHYYYPVLLMPNGKLGVYSPLYVSRESSSDDGMMYFIVPLERIIEAKLKSLKFLVANTCESFQVERALLVAANPPVVREVINPRRYAVLRSWLLYPLKQEHMDILNAHTPRVPGYGEYLEMIG